jgi:hypothetical protein
VIFITATALIVGGTLSLLFNQRIDRWFEQKGSRPILRVFRGSMESAFGKPSEGRTTMKVAIGFLVMGCLMMHFGPVVL